jgi:hypothetical protein
MNMWKRTASSAALLLLVTSVTAVPAMADEPVLIVDPPPTPVKFVEIAAKHTLPAAILVNGQALALDRQPLIKDQTLMVPLRFIAEAAGGKVEWDGATQSITVTMADRTATFRVGQSEAELNQRGVFYIKRNMIKMAMPVQEIAGRTLISADALTQILGLTEREDADLNMDLMVHPAAGDDSAHIEITPTAVAEAAAPEELRTWASALKTEGGVAGYKVVTTASGSYLAIAGGQQPSSGYSIAIVSAKLVDGTWVVEAKVVAPTGPANTIITNPVGYFSLKGMNGNVAVKMVSALPNAKVKGGDAQVTATVVAESALPEELRAWSGALTVEQAASFKVVTTDDGLLVGIAGGMQPTGGYRIELIGDARLVDGTWQIDARVSAPEGMATQVLTNPVAFFKLPGVKGNVQVHFWTNGATP